MTEEAKKILAEGALALGVTLDEKKLSNFGVYLDEIKKWNEKMNLTSITEENEIVTRHFLKNSRPGHGGNAYGIHRKKDFFLKAYHKNPPTSKCGDPLCEGRRQGSYQYARRGLRLCYFKGSLRHRRFSGAGRPLCKKKRLCNCNERAG